MRLRTVFIFFMIGIAGAFLFFRSEAGQPYVQTAGENNPSQAATQPGAKHHFIDPLLDFVHAADVRFPILEKILLAGSALMFGVLLGPGLLAVHLVWSTVLAMPGNPYSHDNPMPWLTIIGLLGFSWFFWRYLFPPALNVVGLYNPFYRQRGGSKVLRVWVRLNEWLQIQRFGVEPTGGWAGWLEVIAHRFRRGDIFLGRPRFMLRPIGLSTERHL